MDPLDRINRALANAAHDLDSAARQIAELRLEPVSQNLDRIGKALVEIFEIQYNVFALRPEFLPEALRGPAEDPELAFQATMERVSILEKAGALNTAIGILNIFLMYQTSEHHLALARIEKARLQNAAAA